MLATTGGVGGGALAMGNVGGGQWQAPRVVVPSGGGRMPLGATGDLDQMDNRGSLTGDKCLCVDLGGVNSTRLCMAAWLEEKSECFVTKPHSGCVTATPEAMLEVSVKDFHTGTASLPKGIELVDVDEKNADSVERRIFPSQVLCREASRNTGNERLLSLLLRACLQASSKMVKAGEGGEEGGEKESKKKKKKKAEDGACNSLTLVVPCSFHHVQYVAASHVAQGTGVALIRNIFNRGVAVTAGVAHRLLTQGEKFVPSLTTPEVSASQYDTLVVLFLLVKEQGFEAALVQCEGGKHANKIGNMLGYERVCTLATAGSEEQFNTASFTPMLDNLVKDALISKDDIKLALLETDSLPSIKSIVEKSIASCLAFHQVFEDDASRGGCLLSAAELDSSKQYIQLSDGAWIVAHQLPIADGFFTCDVGMQVVRNANDTTATIEQLFAANTRLRKTHVGAIRPLTGPAPQTSFRKEFDWGSVYFRDASASFDANGMTYPVVTIYQRKGSQQGEWKLIDTIHPLSFDSSTPNEPVDTCLLSFQLDAATSTLRKGITRGTKISQIKSNHWMWVKAILALLILLLAFGAYKFGSQWQEQAELARDVEWLQKFYSQVAPEKNQNITYITSTVKKYKDKMWILRRQLERQYNAKLEPAPSDNREL